MLTIDKITEIFCIADEFCKSFAIKQQNSQNYSPKTGKNIAKDLAKRGKSTLDWFYGFKLHLIFADSRQRVYLKISL